MSIDGLGSIIESEDNIRFVDDQLSNYFMLHGNAVSPAPVDDQLAFNDADENYDTDLEEDFPGITVSIVLRGSWRCALPSLFCQMNRRAELLLLFTLF